MDGVLRRILRGIKNPPAHRTPLRPDAPRIRLRTRTFAISIPHLTQLVEYCRYLSTLNFI